MNVPLKSISGRSSTWYVAKSLFTFHCSRHHQPGPDAYEVVPNSQLVVARYAYKSNASKYTINERTSSFTEVTTLLKGRGIDLDHKRFLILQVYTS